MNRRRGGPAADSCRTDHVDGAGAAGHTWTVAHVGDTARLLAASRSLPRTMPTRIPGPAQLAHARAVAWTAWQGARRLTLQGELQTATWRSPPMAYMACRAAIRADGHYRGPSRPARRWSRRRQRARQDNVTALVLSVGLDAATFDARRIR